MFEKIGFYLLNEIKEFIAYKRKCGRIYIQAESELNSFEEFCCLYENIDLNPLQLVYGWYYSGRKPKRSAIYCVRQLGQYLTEIGHPKAFIVPNLVREGPNLIGVNEGLFTSEINEYIAKNRSNGLQFITEAKYLKRFDKFASFASNDFLSNQEIADLWLESFPQDLPNIQVLRQFGIYLAKQGSPKYFVVPYPDGITPLPIFAGYSSLFADEIISFVDFKRSKGMAYKVEELCLRNFDSFYCEFYEQNWSLQDLADNFFKYVAEVKPTTILITTHVMKEFAAFLNENGSPKSFEVKGDNKINLPGLFTDEIASFITLKNDSGLSYARCQSTLLNFDAFSAQEENLTLSTQQLADKWSVKRDTELPNTWIGRIKVVRSLGRYLASLGNPKAFVIPEDITKGAPQSRPYFFTDNEIATFFYACRNLKLDKKDKSRHIVIPALFLFIYCLGIKANDSEILVENIDFETGEVIIKDYKSADRVIYMSAELTEIMAKYNLEIDKIYPQRKYLFPASQSICRKDYDAQFKMIWTSALSIDGQNVPNLVDFQHTLIFRNIQRSMEKGQDFNILLSDLMRHLGSKFYFNFKQYSRLSASTIKKLTSVKIKFDWMTHDVLEIPDE